MTIEQLQVELDEINKEISALRDKAMKIVGKMELLAEQKKQEKPA